jgi:hypothetical protein
LLVRYREEIIGEPSMILTIDYDHTTAYSNWSSITHLKARFSTARELNLVAITWDLNRSDLTLGDDDLEAGDVEADTRSKYTSGYAESIENPILGETEVSLEFSSGSPLELEYELHAGDVSVSHVLAPRRDAASGEASG